MMAVNQEKVSFGLRPKKEETFNPDREVFTNLVPIETEMRKNGFVPVIEFLKEKDNATGIPVAVRILDKKYKINSKTIEEMDKETLANFTKWDDLSDVVFMNERTARILQFALTTGKDGVTSALVGLPGATKTFGYKLAAAILNIPLFKFSGHADVEKDDLYGGWKPKEKTALASLEEIKRGLENLNENAPSNEEDNLSNISEEQRKEGIELIGQILQELPDRDKEEVYEWEYEYLASRLGMSTLMSAAGWERDESLLAKAMRLGGFYLIDEASRMKQGAMEGLNPILEWNVEININGKVYRKLTSTEQEAFEKTKKPPEGVIPIHDLFRAGIADNPSGLSADSNEYTDAIDDRIEMMVVRGMEPEELEQFMLFMVLGEQPDIVTESGMVYHGQRGVETPYQNIRKENPESPINSLEEFTDIRSILIWLSRFQSDLNLLIEGENIGLERTEIGGKKKFGLRSIEYFLEHLVKNFVDQVMVNEESITKGEELKQNISLYDAFMDSLETSYLGSFVGDDRRRLDKLVAASGLDQILGDSGKKGPGNIPDWVVKARNSGMSVEMDGEGGFSFNYANLNQATAVSEVEVNRKLELDEELAKDKELAKELKKNTTGLVFDYDYIKSTAVENDDSDRSIFEHDENVFIGHDPEKKRAALEERVDWFLRDFLGLDLTSSNVNVIFNGRDEHIMVEGISVVSTKDVSIEVLGDFRKRIGNESSSKWSIVEKDGSMYLVPKVSAVSDLEEYQVFTGIGQENIVPPRTEGEK